MFLCNPKTMVLLSTCTCMSLSIHVQFETSTVCRMPLRMGTSSMYMYANTVCGENSREIRNSFGIYQIHFSNYLPFKA